MSSRPQLSPEIVISSGDMSGNLTSLVSIVQKVSMFSYALSWTGTAPVGTASVQVSNDYSQNSDGTVKNPGTWNTLTLEVSGAPSTTVPISGSPGSAFIDILQTGAYAVRLIYTFTSGTGNLTATISGKVS